ncbi:MAG TPA: SIMPL domain-containing protein [Thermoanaerobaculia bacterium]|nr:SIMPL domain-containing protein [Thermoanaerobaculia bacterium]
MHRVAGVLFLCLFAHGAFGQLQNCSSETGRTATVNGTATIALVPNRVSFSVGVETQSPAAGEAFRRNTQKVNAVIAALKERGVKPSEIQTTNFAITSRDEEGKRLSGYRVTNLVTVTREDLASVGELLQLAVEKGANEAGALQFSSADQKAAELRGLERAFDDARTKAEKLATLSSKKLGDVVCVSEQGYFPAYGAVAQSITVTAEAPSIETGVQQLTFRVGVVYELK